ATRTAVAEEDPNLAIFDLARRPAVLARHADGLRAFLEEARLVQHGNALGIAEALDRKVDQAIARRVSTPVGGVQEALHAVGRPVAEGFCHLPAVAPRSRSHQRLDVF